ncbi:hypothetical protein [Tepidibacter formicigenes]|jgi:hypothetical protein|uniref:Uncharacterized protein n=1 Tax=Tepidibacter formicigenes DSM 15518 TaxID=1123349 RepID=A0A1M6JZ99_9FIRM|nr:hypothetical protein [Tepidibacter formicigenes]SHJ52029.1 hypothetical protein SAMN02744037_00230 [Tepidibacter formicigenes DSM 15518]
MRRNFRKNKFKNNRFKKNNNVLNKILIQFVISCIIVLLAFGIKLNVLNSEKYLTQIKYVLEYNLNFQQYSDLIHKKVTEVLKIYESEGELE